MILQRGKKGVDLMMHTYTMHIHDHLTATMWPVLQTTSVNAVLSHMMQFVDRVSLLTSDLSVS